MKDISRKENLNISQMAHKLLNGINNNEVRIIPKLSQKLGFFEKFFNYLVSFVFSCNNSCFLIIENSN